MAKLALVVTFVWLLAPAIRAAPPAAVDGRPTFAAWFEREVAAPPPPSADVVAVARRYRYVFVAGFLNEAIEPGYFNENRQTLVDAGVAPDAIHILFPPSVNAIEQTITDLGSAIPALAVKGSERLVLIAHSKGAAEVLAFALSFPEFVRDRVQAIFLVQGALGGSGVADYLAGRGHPLDERMPTKERLAFQLAAQGGQLPAAWVNRGLQSLTRAQAAARWQRLLSRPPGSRPAPRIDDRVFFIRSQRAPKRVSTLLTLTASYLGTYYGDNDGLVTVEDQWVRGSGRVLATLNADHFALTLARPVSAEPARVRQAFTRALLMQLAGAFRD